MVSIHVNIMKSFNGALLAKIVFGLLAIFSSHISHANELKVVATIKPVHSILAGLMKGIEQPKLLIEGLPHKYKADRRAQQTLAESDLVVWVGSELERELQSTLSSLPEKVKVIELLSNPNLKILSKRYDDNRRDPYFWLDSRNTLILLDELA
ncbi:MAG: zinc ABC transporter substrate-binding protein, partial [Gammaproteobacteria bacterium]|nr:zinc ABC transporter substrate-binding protein [Gammaproteobacteria bacterium]